MWKAQLKKMHEGKVWPYTVLVNFAGEDEAESNERNERIKEFFESEQRSISNFVRSVHSNSTRGPLIFCINL